MYLMGNVCFDFLLTFLWNFSQPRNNWVRMYNEFIYVDFQIKCLLFLSHFNETWIFLTDISKSQHYKISRKSNQWTLSCSMQVDRHSLMNGTKKITRTVNQKPTIDRLHASDDFYYWLSTVVVQFSHQEMNNSCKAFCMY